MNKHEALDDYPGNLHCPSVSKLFFLLIIIPLISVGAILMSLEYTEDITIRDTQFGHVFVGLQNKSTSVIDKWEMMNAECSYAKVQLSVNEEWRLRFFICESEDDVPVRTPVDGEINIVFIRSLPFFYVIITAQSGNSSTAFQAKRTYHVLRREEEHKEDEHKEEEQNKTAEQDSEQIDVVPNVFFVTSNFTEQEMNATANEILNAFDKKSVSLNRFVSFSFIRNPGIFNSDFLYSCTSKVELQPDINSAQLENITRNAGREVLKSITFISSPKDELRLWNYTNHDVRIATSGEELTLYRRRSSYVTIPVLALCVLGSLFGRLVTSNITNNDIALGIDLIVKDGLGLPCCDSMLSSHDISAEFEPQTCEMRGYWNRMEAER